MTTRVTPLESPPDRGKVQWGPMRRAVLVFGLVGLGCSTGSHDDHADGGHTGDSHFDVAIEVDPFVGSPTLEGTGLYTDATKKTLGAGVMPYTVRYELWSDEATKKRYLFVPPGAKIDTSNPDHWKFPVGTKSWKEFAVGGTVVETRFLQKNPDGKWTMVAYLWSPDGTTKAVPAGVTGALGSHDVPSDEDCHRCHDGVGDSLIGVSLFQLSRVKLGGATKSPLVEFSDKGLFTAPVSEVDPPGTGDLPATLGYLHGNCGHCHNDVGIWAGVSGMRLRLRASDKVPEETEFYTTTIGKPALHAKLGGTDNLIVAGDPAKSQVFYRMTVRDFNQMPPLATKKLDVPAVALVKAWITGMK